MLDLVIVDTLAYLATLTDTDLPGVLTFQKSDADVPTMLQPAIICESDGVADHTNNGNHVDIKANFGLMLYLTSMQSKEVADKQLADLIVRWDTALHRFAGLLPALWRRRKWQHTASGQYFFLEPHSEVRVGRIVSKNQQHYSLGAALRFTARTLFEPPQYT